MQRHRQPFTATPTSTQLRTGGLWLLGALTIAAFTDRFTALHTDERTAAAIAAAAAAVSITFTLSYGSTPPPLRQVSRAAAMYLVAVLAATVLVIDMTTTGW